MEPSPQSSILLLGNDPALAYLIGRYAQQSGYGVTTLPGVPQAEAVCALKPATILFTSIESLETAQSLVSWLGELRYPRPGLLLCGG